ncbi:MAG: DNA ligase-associated DEXH box helicase, partial [Chitinophagales bacterium]|nr:DNA ligase-associated DEXH box helicase [Chitinophagales bacterium]
VIPIIEKSKTTLIFTNTRSQAEIWYQRILDIEPDLAGVIAMHHGSISKELRTWVEEALHSEELKAVVCTSSLDLGVDFRPVETIIQIGSPKGIARFVQRAGRSGHKPGELSRIYFVPTHSLELIEAAALRTAIQEGKMESRIPYIRSYDTLIQYLVTLAVSDGFYPDEVYQEVKTTHCFQYMEEDEWHWMLNFITKGGQSLRNYDEFHKVVVEDGKFLVRSGRVAMRHRMAIGTIVSDSMLTVRIIRGKRLGHVEEYFVSRMKAGDVFWFAGQSLEFVRIKEMTVQVRRSNKRSGRTPAWQGGRLPLSSQMSELLRRKIMEAGHEISSDKELQFLEPMIELQRKRTLVPKENELLIEYFPSRLGWHMVAFPWEGRNIHEVMGALIAYRIGQQIPISFSIGMNDYGFELLSDQEIDIEDFREIFFDPDNIMEDLKASINAAEMAMRKFRDVAGIAGLIFKGYPGKPKKERHIQSTASLFFKVFNEHEPDNLLLKQAFDEVFDFELEEERFKKAIRRIASQKIRICRADQPTPFSFPIIAEGIRERVTYENLEDRIKKMQLQYGSGNR